MSDINTCKYRGRNGERIGQAPRGVSDPKACTRGSPTRDEIGESVGGVSVPIQCDPRSAHDNYNSITTISQPLQFY
jgi:hypothetical protein